MEERGAERSTDGPCLVRTDRASTREPSTTPSSLEAVAFTATSGRRGSAQEDQRFSVHIDDDLLSAHWWSGVASLLRLRSTLMTLSCPQIGGLEWRRFFIMQTRDLVASVGSGGSRDLAAPTAARVEWLPVVVCGCLG